MTKSVRSCSGSLRGDLPRSLSKSCTEGRQPFVSSACSPSESSLYIELVHFWHYIYSTYSKSTVRKERVFAFASIRDAYRMRQTLQEERDHTSIYMYVVGSSLQIEAPESHGRVRSTYLKKPDDVVHLLRTLRYSQYTVPSKVGSDGNQSLREP